MKRDKIVIFRVSQEELDQLLELQHRIGSSSTSLTLRLLVEREYKYLTEFGKWLTLKEYYNKYIDGLHGVK